LEICKSMRIIGLTGGIGSGKSTIAGIFKTLGIPVYESDYRAKELMTTDEELKKRILALLGDEAYNVDGHLNRSWIAHLVFADRSKLDLLNEIVHPAVYQDLLQWTQHGDQLQAPYVLQESAILFEENLTGRLDGMIIIVANEELRISRVMDRDHISRKEVLKRMQHQWRDDQKIPAADYIIFNDGIRSLITQAKDIHDMIRARFTTG